MSQAANDTLGNGLKQVEDQLLDIVIYDGDCPFCRNFIQLMRLRELRGQLAVISAREPGVSAWSIKNGFDLDDGMLARFNGEFYYGSDAMWIISTLGSRGLRARLMNTLISHRTFMRVIYPALKRGRRLTLRLLGRRAIANG